MAHKDPELRREYQRQLMARRRARQKESIEGGVNTTAPPSSNSETILLPNPDLPQLKKKDSGSIATQAGAATNPTPRAFSDGASELVQANEVAKKTEELLEKQGWALWKCELLNGAEILILRDQDVEKYPQGYPIYTTDDLKSLISLSDKTIRMIHETKKAALVQVLPGFEIATVGN